MFIPALIERDEIKEIITFFCNFQFIVNSTEYHNNKIQKDMSDSFHSARKSGVWTYFVDADQNKTKQSVICVKQKYLVAAKEEKVEHRL